jgi:hypothetical protein
MLLMVDHSQGHCMYRLDALLVSRMNLNPGGKQAHMRDGWWMDGSVRRIQKMDYPADHREFPGEPKGMKVVLQERGLWPAGRFVKECKKGLHAAARDCCATRMLELQPDFLAQRSMIAETIEDAGHLVIFCPKYHCELNFIEFFWGAVKKYLRDHCDYTYEGLKTNMPAALASVSRTIIRKWEHRMIRWMDAYRGNAGPKEAQRMVRAFSSTIYTSHRRVPETFARRFDQ